MLKILITGGAGSIGSELARQLSKTKCKLFLLDDNETGIFNICNEIKSVPIIANIREEETIKEIFKKIKPDIVYHCAAYKHVPLMEMYPEEARATNVYGTHSVLKAAEEQGAKVIFVSTDKAIEPTSVMGKTKKEAEELCSDYGAVIIRFGNVLASRGSIIPIWREQIERNEDLTLTDLRMERYFMTLSEACELIINVSKMDSGIYMFNMGKPIKIIDLANQMIRMSGKDLGIKIIGIRPGEKLREKLLNKGEKFIKTNHKKIFKVCKR